MADRGDPADAARHRMTAAALAAFAAGQSTVFADRRSRRTFDPTWAEFGDAVRHYATVLCDGGQLRDDAIAAVMATLSEVLPQLPPHHAFRASAAGWAAAACFGRE